MMAHGPNLTSLDVDINSYQVLFFYIENLDRFTNLEKIFLRWLNFGDISTYTSNLQNINFSLTTEHLYQFNRNINDDIIQIETVGDSNAKACYQKLCDYLGWPLFVKRKSHDRVVADIFKILLDPKMFIEQAFKHKPELYDILSPSFENDFFLDDFNIILIYAFYEALFDEIYKLPKIEYIQIIAHGYTLESPRFQELFRHPVLKRILITEENLRNHYTLDELWYFDYTTRVENPPSPNYCYLPAVIQLVHTYEVDVETLRKNYNFKN